MSISVQGLVKTYGTQNAVNNISFEVKKGEILGFLGPNGAGKSTTMKIICGYQAPTRGKVEVNGLDVVKNQQAVKKTIGYLAEHNPLYTDMFVHEYLQFAGKIFGIRGKKLKERIAELLELTGLKPEQTKKLGQLSKGYRQRVGLAQALIHNPDILILDEPTTGLDPNQIIEIRKLIKTIGEDKSVIFSSHILQEVQNMCNRVVIINHGNIVADTEIDLLTTQGNTTTYELEFETTTNPQILSEIEGVIGIVAEQDNKLIIEATKDKDLRPALLKAVANNNLPLLGINKRSTSLEEVFKKLTAN